MSDELYNDLLDMDDGDLIDVDRQQWNRAPFPMPGAKYRSLEQIIPRLQITKSSIWADHFGGSGVVSWNVPECRVMMFNDAYSGIVCFYKCLRENKQALLDYLNLMPPHAREEWINCRQTWVTETDSLIRAAKWYYMTKLSVIGKGGCFGRGLRTRFIPLGAGLELFDSIHRILQSFTLENLDVFVSLQDYDSPQTVHYLDPPYIGTDPGLFKHKWTREQQRQLLHTISRLKGRVVLSHYPDSEINDAPFWTERHRWDVRLSDVTDFGLATECLFIKEAAHASTN